jgi:hypothetical protein
MKPLEVLVTKILAVTTRNGYKTLQERKLVLHSILLMLLTALIFDFFVASGSIVPLRFMYDTAFAIILFVVMYTSVLLFKNKKLPENYLILTLPRISFVLPIILNLKAIFAIASLDVPRIGFLNHDILLNINNLFLILDYLTINLANGYLLYLTINRKAYTHLYDMPTYVLGIIAIEAFSANYFFHFGGVTGFRWGAAVFHLAFCGIAVWLYHKLRMRENHIVIGCPDMLLTFLSLGIFLMVFIPFGIYNLFGDNAVVVGSALSIAQRGSLQPYYVATDYYSPIGGFVSIVFAYISGLDNVLLASSLPFLTAHLMLPFITYCFLKEIVIDDSRIAIVGTVMAILMDGLAVLLLPVYIGNLTHMVVTWRISPATKSLYFSSIAWIWFAPYKIMGMASATAMGDILSRKSAAGPLLGGALLGFSFINPREPFLAILILVLLFGIENLNLKELLALFLATLVFLGPISGVTIFKMLEQLTLYYLRKVGLIAEETSAQTISCLRLLADNASLLMIPTVLISLIAIVFLIRSNFKNITKKTTDINRFTAEYVSKKRSAIKLRIRGKTCNIFLSSQDITLIGLSIVLLTYISFEAYQYSAYSFAISTNIFLAPINYIILRYHILVALIIVGFFGFKHNPRILVTLAALASFMYLALLGGYLIIAPLVVVVMALPTLSSFVKFQKKLITFVVLLFVLLGVFSATFYSATIKSAESEPQYVDLPFILHVLLSEDSNEEIFSVSSYSYYPWRIANMANLRLTLDPSVRLHLIDRRYAPSTVIERLLKIKNKIKILYRGDVFILYESALDRTLITPNPGFEFGTDGPYNWTSKKTDAYHKAYWDEVVAWSGNRSLNLSVEKDPGTIWVRWESDKIFLPRDTLFLCYEYYVKQDLNVGSSLVQFNFYDFNGELIKYERIWQNENSDWMLRTGLIDFPNKTSYLDIYLVNLGEGKVWFDDVKLYAFN